MHLRSNFLLFFALGLTSCSPTTQNGPQASSHMPAWQVLSGRHFEHWTGVTASHDSPEATLQDSSEAVFRYPDGPKGWIKHGFHLLNDGTADWHQCECLTLDIHLVDDRPVQVKALIATPNEADESSMVPDDP